MKYYVKHSVIMLFVVCAILCGNKTVANASSSENGFVIEEGVLVSYTGTATELTIPTTVKEIGAQAFAGNAKITKVVISNTVKTIQSGAFEGCTKVKVYGKALTEELKTQLEEQNITYYEIASHKIKYNLNEGTNSTKNLSAFTTGTSVKLENPTRKGYKFAGWYKESTFKTKVTTISMETTTDVVLYAKWTAISYTITYQLKGGENNSSNQTSYTIESKKITLSTPTRSGYYFVGWYKSGDKVTSIKTGSTGNITVTAKWSKYSKKVYTKKATTIYKTNAKDKKLESAVKDKLYYAAGVTVGSYTPVMNVTTKKVGFVKTSQLTTKKPTTSIVNKTKTYYDYSTMEKNLKTLVKTYPQWMTLTSLGKTYDKREIYCVTIGNTNAKKQVVVTASMHSREYLNTYFCMNMIEYYLNNYSKKGAEAGVTYEDLYDEVCLYIVPMVNPDGVQIAQYGPSGLNSKSLQKSVKKILNGKSYKTWKNNARGVNLNRNFPAQWAKVVSSKKPDATSYAGKSAGSEKETQAIIKLYDSLSNPVASIAYHSMGNTVDWNGSGKYYSISKKIAYKTKRLTGYSLAASDLSGGVGGTMGTWLSQGEHNMPNITIETGSVACPLPFSQYNTIWKKNKYVIEAVTKLYY